MEFDPIGTDARRAKQRRVLPPDAACLLCGETAPEALVPVSRSWLEAHHVVGEVNDPDFTVALCLTCHAKATERQRVHGVPLEHATNRSEAEEIAAILLGLSAFEHTKAEALAGYALRLLALRNPPEATVSAERATKGDDDEH
jgi:hypothetical protein